jgi:hypothetical protein
MTIIEMHALCDLLIDKADAPWFSPVEKDNFIDLAQIEYLDNSYRFFELNEEIREKLLPLVRSTSFAGPVPSIDLSALIATDNFRYILSLRGDLTDDCGVLHTRAIPPIQLDDEVDNQEDPFNKNDDENPGYTQENNGTSNLVLFVSTTNPVSIILKFLKTPVDVFNDVNNPLNNVNCELSDSSHEEIVNIAVRKMLGTVQDQLQYQIQSQEAQIQ